MIEKITGLTWDGAMREKIYAPLGLTHTVTLPEEALLFRTAAGHVDVRPSGSSRRSGSCRARSGRPG